MKIYCDSSTKKACIVAEGPVPIVIHYAEPVTNNVGEYQAVILALEWAKRLKRMHVELLTDSQLVVNQVSGLWKCRMKHLLPLRDKVRGLLGCSCPTELKWIPREENLAGRILDG